MCILQDGALGNIIRIKNKISGVRQNPLCYFVVYLFPLSCSRQKMRCEMKKICQNCKYYEPPRWQYPRERDMGSCVCDKFIQKYKADESDYPLKDKVQITLNAMFYVGKNFGCIHFKPKKKEV